MQPNFEKLVKKLQLSRLLFPPELLTGGLSHTTYSVTTEQGKFVLKLLNPAIMQRTEAPENFRNSEALAQMLTNELPVVAALPIDGDVLIPFENNIYMLFPFVQGHVLKKHEITAEHCDKIGKILTTIHAKQIRISGKIADAECPFYSWGNYPALASHAIELEFWNFQANKATTQLNKNLVMSHRDLDPKNILWNNDLPCVIDWEAAGLINPYVELWECCINWGGDAEGGVSTERVTALLNSYWKGKNLQSPDWEVVSCAGYAGMLGWLDYNAKRMSSKNLSPQEVQLGKEQVKKTLYEFAMYDQKRSQILKLTPGAAMPCGKE